MSKRLSIAAKIGGIKRTVAGLSSSKKGQLKKFLNTRKARITYLATSGKVVVLTF